MRSAVRAGMRIGWRTAGSGRGRAIFVHCTLASSRSLLPIMQLLDLGGEKIAFDLPGHGESAEWDGQGDYLRRSVDVAGSFLESPSDVIGHSFGAVVVLSLMARRPDLVSRAVLVEPVFFAAAAGTDAYDLNDAEYAEIRAALNENDREAATRKFTAIWGTGEAWPELPEAQRRSMMSRIHLVAASAPGLVDDSTGILTEGRLERIEAPVLLVRGAETHPVIGEIFDSLRRRLPSTASVVIEGAGHMVPVTHPEETARMIGRHIGGHASAS